MWLMDTIIENIWAWKDAYYNEDGSPVDDAEYDLWWANLLFLEKKYPKRVRKKSPTRGVGASTEKDKKK